MGSLRFSEKALDKFIDLQLMAAFEANRPQPQGSSYEDSFDYQSDLSEWTRDQFRWVDSERGNARRALLSQLLEAEGLPGVEEIEDLKRDLDNAESTIDKLMAENQRLRDLNDMYQRRNVEVRTARLHELLEAEARERVEITTDEWSNERVRVDGREVTINYAYGRVFLIDHDAKELDPKTAEDYERLSLSFAALAEKRRRELAHEITQPVDPVSMAGESEVSE